MKVYLSEDGGHLGQLPVDQHSNGDWGGQRQQRDGHFAIGDDERFRFQVSAIQPDVEGHHEEGHHRRKGCHRHTVGRRKVLAIRIPEFLQLKNL